MEIKKTISRCIPCFRFRASSQEQMMGNLPAVRVEVCRPFTNTGVDYAGPLDVKA